MTEKTVKIHFICDPEKATTCPKTACKHNKEAKLQECDQTTYLEWAARDKDGMPILAPPDFWYN